MSGTLHFPDIYSGDAGINFSTSYVVIAKATQGTGYTNPSYNSFKSQAQQHHVYFVAYHFLTQGNAAAQAQHCFNTVGAGVPLALDVETTQGSNPTLNDVIQFIDEYRKLGGNHLFVTYLPHWYWQQIGSPDLTPLRQRSQWLWTSNYQNYSDNGPGWQGYGGLGVAMWQYSDTVSYGGIGQVDFSAFKGTGSADVQQTLREFDSLVKTGKM